MVISQQVVDLIDDGKCRGTSLRKARGLKKMKYNMSLMIPIYNGIDLKEKLKLQS